MREITVSDYFVEFLIANGVTDVFGYQGGMIAYIFDSLGKYRDQINYHSNCNEQGAAFAACAYAQATGRMGVAISTSGPGFTNMLTGMANAWFDSLPVLFVSGNVNTKDKKRTNSFRQNGFQEIQAAKMAEPITKASIEIELDTEYAECFDKAFVAMMTGRKGPVYLDLPINVCREKVLVDEVKPVTLPCDAEFDAMPYIEKLKGSEKPVIIAGAGIKQAGCIDEFRELVKILNVPVITTMPGLDVLPTESHNMIGYIGGTARREAGLVLQNADFVLSIGTRLCSKQVGHNLSLFAPKAKTFVRVDIDPSEFERKLKPDEIDVNANIRAFLESAINGNKFYDSKFNKWSDACFEMHELLKDEDVTIANQICTDISKILPEDSNVLFDVGKNLTYGAQSWIIKNRTRLFISAGLGSMGYAIPAAIGAYYGNRKPTYSINGDGGAQMNIQELNYIAKNKLPIKIFILNNQSLGNIMLFQESYLDTRYVATRQADDDYCSCDFVNVGKGFGIKTIKLKINVDWRDYTEELTNDAPVIFDIYYDDCPALPGIVAGGEFLKNLSEKKVDAIRSLLK